MVTRLIDVTVDADKAIAYINRIAKQLPEKVGNIGWNITQKEAKYIRNEGNSVFTFPRPYLATTIKAEPLGKYKYAVVSGLKRKQVMAIERGRLPGGTPPPVKNLIKRWAEMAGKNPYALSKSIGKKGTIGKHFIRNGMIKAKPEIDEYVRKEARRLVE